MRDSKSLLNTGFQRVAFSDHSPVYFIQLPERFWVLKNKAQTDYSKKIANTLPGLMMDENGDRTSTVEKRSFSIFNGVNPETKTGIHLPPDRCRQLWKSGKPLLRELERCFPDTSFGGGWLETYVTAYGKQHAEHYFALDATPLDVAFKLFPTRYHVYAKLGIPLWMPPENDWEATRGYLEQLPNEIRWQASPGGIPKTYADFVRQQSEHQLEGERRGLKVTWVEWTVEQRNRFPEAANEMLSHPRSFVDFPSMALMIDAGWHENPFCFPNEGKGYERISTVEGVK